MSIFGRRLQTSVGFEVLLVLFLFTAPFFSVLEQDLHGAEDRPNIILIMPDDQGYGDLGAHGHQKLDTPHLDQLHEESVRFHNFHVDATCSPTRAALLTGRYANRTGVWHTIAGRSLMAPGERTIAEVLSDHGYRTGHFGKWHLGDNAPLRPQDQGFQHVLRNGGGGVTQTPDYWGNDYFDDTYFQNGRPVTFRGFCTDVWFDNAIEFVRRNRNRPFFCHITPNAAHGPFRAPDEYREPYEEKGYNRRRAAFYGMITNIDDNVGRLRSELQSLGIEKETIFIFLTDNGTAIGNTDDGLRGSKGSHYDGGHRVPFMIRYPDEGFTGGRTVDTLAAHIDLLPTFADLLDLGPIESPRGDVDGRSLVPLLNGNASNWPDRTLFMDRQRTQKPKKWRSFAVMTDRWRLNGKNELYDMKEDRAQKNNVADQHPDVVKRLRKKYNQWWSSLEPRYDEYVRIEIGSTHENPARITAHDWHNPGSNVPWNQNKIKNMPEVNGWWAVRVARSGTYRFTLRHMPSKANKTLQATKARLKVGEVDQSKSVPDGATSVSFEVKLDPGPTRLQTWLENDNQSRGAFFIQVRRLD